MKPKHSVVKEVELGKDVRLFDHVNLYKCKIGARTKIDAFVYIEEGVTIGEDCKVRPHCFIPTGVRIGDRVFLGPGVIFTNDKKPRSINPGWRSLSTLVEDDASIGAAAVILPGITIGRGAMVGAGAVVTTDVEAGTTVVGNPARPLPPSKTTPRRSRT